MRTLIKAFIALALALGIAGSALAANWGSPPPPAPQHVTWNS